MPPTDALRQAMEQSLAANPDDLATHMAYADHLVELGDPRGEFIQVQLALEDPRRSAEERRTLQAREQELLGRHQREWIGEAAELLLAQPESPVDAFNRLFGLELYRAGGFKFRFARGWLDALVLPQFSPALAEALGRSPTIRLLRQLSIEEADYDHNGQEALARWPCLDCVRSFQIGPSGNCHITGDGLLPVVAGMKRIEELYLYAHLAPTAEIFALPMPNLRKLHVYHIYEYPLDVLGNNPTLGNLVELSCWPHGLEPGDDRAYIQPGPFRELCFSPHLKSLTHLELYLTDLGDEGVRAIVESGLLKRLRVLDLWSGRITDEGARLLASSPDIRHLQRLRLSQNALTEAGVEALRATGVSLEADRQLAAGSFEENAHLWEGDME
jgi:uncharacterized protein (TIGR02996 family)